jgi:hypothetical protein
MDARMSQFILIRIEFGFAENKSVTGGLFVSRRPDKSGVDGGYVM